MNIQLRPYMLMGAAGLDFLASLSPFYPQYFFFSGTIAHYKYASLLFLEAVEQCVMGTSALKPESVVDYMFQKAFLGKHSIYI